jgi:hypothetical protein
MLVKAEVAGVLFVFVSLLFYSAHSDPRVVADSDPDGQWVWRHRFIARSSSSLRLGGVVSLGLSTTTAKLPDLGSTSQSVHEQLT